MEAWKDVFYGKKILNNIMLHVLFENKNENENKSENENEKNCVIVFMRL